MKAPYLENFEPERNFYQSGKIKSETYMVHMSYIVYKYAEDGTLIGLTVNGMEYPTNSYLDFQEKVLIVRQAT